ELPLRLLAEEQVAGRALLRVGRLGAHQDLIRRGGEARAGREAPVALQAAHLVIHPAPHVGAALLGAGDGGHEERRGGIHLRLGADRRQGGGREGVLYLTTLQDERGRLVRT